MSLGRILQLHEWANIVYSNGNMFSSQEAMQEDEVFSIGLEYLDENVQIAFFPQCICLFLISYIAMWFTHELNEYAVQHHKKLLS